MLLVYSIKSSLTTAVLFCSVLVCISTGFIMLASVTATDGGINRSTQHYNILITRNGQQYDLILE